MYIFLKLNNGRYYTGLTWNPEVRYEQHLLKFGSKYTARYGIKELVYLEEHQYLEVARNREVQIKDFSQKKKLQLINKFKEFSKPLGFEK